MNLFLKKFQTELDDQTKDFYGKTFKTAHRGGQIVLQVFRFQYLEAIATTLKEKLPIEELCFLIMAHKTTEIDIVEPHTQLMKMTAFAYDHPETLEGHELAEDGYNTVLDFLNGLSKSDKFFLLIWLKRFWHNVLPTFKDVADLDTMLLTYAEELAV